jgi:hypothetical protein
MSANEFHFVARSVMHDAFGRALKVGDRVMVPAVVKQIATSVDYCNAELEVVATMPPEHRFKTTVAAINTQQILRANDGDDVAYVVQADGTKATLHPVDVDRA